MSLNKEIKAMNISELHFPEKNVRIHTQRQIKEFIRSIEMFGQIRPAIIDENNVIMVGCGLVEAMHAKGETKVEVYQVTGLSKNTKKKLMMADNKVFSLGVDNLEAIENFIHELSDDLDIPGFDENVLQAMVAEAEQVTMQIADYGKINTDIQNSLRAAEERKENLIERSTATSNYIPANTPQTYEANVESGAEDEKVDINKYVVCPKCGEKICL